MVFPEIPLTAIDFEDETFRISEELHIDLMRASLQAVGLICPVVLLQRAETSRFTILCGFRRLHGLSDIGAGLAAARILTPGAGNARELFLKALWDNIAHRRLDPLETARALFVLSTTCEADEDVLVQHFLPLFGLSPHRNLLETYLRLHQLQPGLRRLLSAGHLSIPSAERLARMEPAVQAEISPLVESVRLSSSLQRQFLDLAEDLSAINQVSLGEILASPEIKIIAADLRLTPFQKGEQIYDLLYRRRNPRLTLARDKFRADRAEMNLPGHIRLSGDPFFETPRLHVEFDVTSARAFREAVAALEQSCTKSSLDRIFEVY